MGKPVESVYRALESGGLRGRWGLPGSGLQRPAQIVDSLCGQLQDYCFSCLPRVTVGYQRTWAGQNSCHVGRDRPCYAHARALALFDMCSSTGLFAEASCDHASHLALAQFLVTVPRAHGSYKLLRYCALWTPSAARSASVLLLETSLVAYNSSGTQPVGVRVE